jgi:hypothetical protein
MLASVANKSAPVKFCAADTHGRVWSAPRREFKKARAAAEKHAPAGRS